MFVVLIIVVGNGICITCMGIGFSSGTSSQRASTRRTLIVDTNRIVATTHILVTKSPKQSIIHTNNIQIYSGVAAASLLGILAPLMAAILPIRSALQQSLRESLDVRRAGTPNLKIDISRK
jgi:hypothetical protein